MSLSCSSNKKSSGTDSYFLGDCIHLQAHAGTIIVSESKSQWNEKRFSDFLQEHFDVPLLLIG